MREKNENKKALLVTEDPAVETIVRYVAHARGNDLRHLRTNEEALCGVMDAYPDDSFAIVDLDAPPGTHLLLNTAAGKLRIITVCAEDKPWLSSMLRHHRIEANLAKPVSVAAMTKAFELIRNDDGLDARLAN